MHIYAIRKGSIDMACFVVPMGEAIAVSVVQKAVKDEKKKEQLKKNLHLDWLNKLLWGGTILLAVEHVWHGEVVPWPPFLTAMANPADVSEMLHEMATVGGTMAGVITGVWGIMVLIARRKARRAVLQQKLTLQVE
jgi:nitrate reductase gamma subunit